VAEGFDRKTTRSRQLHIVSARWVQVWETKSPKKLLHLEKKRMQQIIEKRREDLRNICQVLKIKRLYAFGSVVSDKFTEKSDIDFLISFSDSLTVDEYTNNYFSLHYKLRELFNREIDIVTERTLSNPYFIESINQTKELIYEA
jgi:predicted nucleotidyltransferase